MDWSFAFFFGLGVVARASNIQVLQPIGSRVQLSMVIHASVPMVIVPTHNQLNFPINRLVKWTRKSLKRPRRPSIGPTRLIADIIHTIGHMKDG